METGLFDDEYDTTTYKWREIKNFTSPRVEKLGPVLNQLTWQGACTDDEVGSFSCVTDRGVTSKASAKDLMIPLTFKLAFLTIRITITSCW